MSLITRARIGAIALAVVLGWGDAASAAAPIKLNGPLVAGGDVSSVGRQFSPDSSRVLYQADQTTDGVDEIFSVSSAVDGVGDVGLSPSLAFNDYGSGFPSIAYFNSGSNGSGDLFFIEDPPAPAVPEPATFLLVAWAAIVRRIGSGRRFESRLGLVQFQT